MKKYILATLLIAINFIAFAGGGWTHKKEAGYAQFSYTFMNYNSIHNGSDAPLHLQRKVTDRTLQAYAEYGLSDNLELDMVFPYKMVSTSESLNSDFSSIYTDTLDPSNLSGLGNIYTGVKYSLGEGKYAHAIRIGYGWNPSAPRPRLGLQTGFSTNYLNASYFVSKGYKKTYINLDAGYQYMGGVYADYFIGNFEIGRKVNYTDKVYTWFAFTFQSQLAVEDNTERNSNYLYTGLYVNGASYLSLGIKLNNYINEHYSITLGIYGGFWAKFQAQAPSVNIGMAYDW